MIKVIDWLNKNKYLKNFLTLNIGFFIIELIFKITMEIPVADYSTLRIYIGLVIFSTFISIPISYANNLVSKIINSILLLLFSILCIAQGGFYYYFGTFMSLGTSSQAGAVGYFVSDFLQSIKPNQYFILIPIGLYIVYAIVDGLVITKKLNQKEENEINKKVKKKRKKDRESYLATLKNEQKLKVRKINNISRIIGVVVFVGFLPLYYCTLTASFMQNPLQVTKNKVLFNNPSMPNIAVAQFGISGYEFIDIKAQILGVTAEDEEEVFVKEEQIITDKSRQIDDTAWIAANEEETNKDYKKLNSYFMSKKITDKNDYTGLFEGKNLILIMMESASNVLFDYPQYFPNINRIADEGWSFVNEFSPRSSCATGNNEMTGMTSLYPINDTCTVNTYKNNKYYEAIFNLFNYKGYRTQSFHDYTDHFYARSVFHPNMGSQKYYGVYDIGIKLGSEYQPWPSDVEMIEKALPKFIKQDKFMTWMTTVSAHMTYNGWSETGAKYYDTFKKEKWSTQSKRYMSKLVILDKAIGRLVELLEAEGKLEDTVIVLFADHYPYGLSDSNFNEISKYPTSYYGNIDRTPLIIYNPSLESQKFEQYTSFINIVPTLANLFNLDYDPRLYGGHDLLSEDYPNYIVFSDGSWRTDIAYYNASKGKVTYFGEEEYSDEELIKINTEIKNEMKMDALAIQKNYFKYLAEIQGKEVLKKPYVEETIPEEQSIDVQEEEQASE